MRLRFNFITIFAAILLFSTGALALEVPERPVNYVTDQAGIIEQSTEAAINRYLGELEQKTTAQFAVLTIDTLDGGSIEEVSLAVAEKWALGQKGKDNGLLLLVALKDRKYRFEVGYGLEGTLPDSLVGSIGRDNIAPYFRQGDYSRGVALAVAAAGTEIARQSGATLPPLTIGSPRPEGPRDYAPVKRKSSFMDKILTVLFFIFIIYMFIRHPRLMLALLIFSSLGGGRRSSWGGGGGFGGGGFGGGGGGGFGGGGASGGW